MNNNYQDLVVFKQSRAAFLPAGWQLAIVGDVCRICDELRLPLSELERQKIKGAYPYYGPTGPIDYINTFRIEGSFALIGEDGDHFLKFSKNPMTQVVKGKFNVNNHAHIVAGTNHCTVEWFFYYFLHRDITNILSRQGAGRYKLTKSSLEKLPILLPPLKEQQKIVEILSTWDQIITLTTKLIAAKKQYKQGLMQQLLTGKKRFQEFSNQEWEIKKLGDLFWERREIGRCDLPLLSITSKNGIVSRDSVERRDTSTEDKSRYLRICKGDIGYNTMRMWQGVSAVSRLEGIVSPAYTICVPFENVDADYMGHLFKSSKIIHTFLRYSQGMVDDTLNLKFDSFATIEIAVPPLAEQKRIAEVLNVCDQEIALHEQNLSLLQKQKQGLMQQLLTGKVRVQV